jgi:hypothetical protein
VQSHFLLLVLFALLVSAVFALLMRDDPREQVRTGAWMFAAFIGSALILGWFIYPFPF